MDSQKQGSDSFDEFKDRDFADWKRVRSSIEHENLLVNHRLSWLFASHAFLLSAFAVVFNAARNTPLDSSYDLARVQYQILLILIVLLGTFLCLSIFNGLQEAEKQIRHLDRWWHAPKHQAKNYWSNGKKRKEQQDEWNIMHPPIQGQIGYYGKNNLNHHMRRLVSHTLTPLMFLLVWVLILLFVILGYSLPLTAFIAKYGLVLILMLLTGILAIFADRSWRSISSSIKKDKDQSLQGPPPGPGESVKSTEDIGLD